MEAKDTIRYLPNEYRECADEDGVIRKYKVPIHEPSFKAGQDSVFDSMPENLPPLLEKAWRTGIREVVEWIIERYHADPEDETFLGGIFIPDCDAEWQAKLKEWGIKEVYYR